MRTRSTGVISFWTVRIGLTRSVEPIQALAAPMRPPRRRNSSVSMANHRLQLAARRGAGARRSRRPAQARRRRVRRREHEQPEAAGRGGGVEHVDALAALALPLERLGGAPRGLGRAGQAAGDVDRHDLAAVGQQRLVDGGEVAHRGLRGGRQALGRPQLLEERVVVGDVRLGHGAVAAEDDVERHDVDPVPLDDIRREVRGAVRDDRDASHARGSLFRLDSRTEVEG